MVGGAKSSICEAARRSSRVIERVIELSYTHAGNEQSSILLEVFDPKIS